MAEQDKETPRKAKVILFANGKGGTGKTRLSILTILALAHLGYRVGWIDTDRQQTTAKAMKAREDAGDEPRIRRYEDNPEEFDYVIVDCPPRLDERPFLRELARADLVCLVVMPDFENLWGLIDSLQQLAKIPGAAEKPYVIIINGVMHGRALAKKFPQQLLDNGIDLPLLTIAGSEKTMEVYYREQYKWATVGGWEVLDDAGRLEVTLLARAVLGQLPAEVVAEVRPVGEVVTAN